ncbi:MAG: flavodoxin family protein [Bacillota bacterium]|nr:flavodoxin family protein [Bacillota bacterium]
MQVLLVNGSPHEKGCTYTALCEVAKALEIEGIKTEIFHIGTKPVRGCMGCAHCRIDGKCVYNDDPVNAALEKAKNADGFVFGSPVHYAGPSGALTSFLDRFFYAGTGFAYKPVAAVVCCRRGGAASAFDQLNKYFTISGMPVVSSQYWNMVYGETPEEALQDLEGMQTMRTLGQNMAWLLKCIDAGKKCGVDFPQKEKRQVTNFIR